ncbi:hypothetical protein ABZT45_46935 [Streptomyces sp. NPDC005356]|uniref:hypothetical protein n=1 Tax=unclassified Streptomyces TaxID=2593676 RepID=UPI0033AE9829
MVEDPHETRNLADDPAYAGVVERMAAALAAWQERYGDLGALDEDELLERWRPGGVWPQAEPPLVRVKSDEISAQSTTEGSVVVWTDDPCADVDVPTTPADRMGSPRDAIGAPEPDGRYWRIACAATPIPRDRPVWAKTVRLGWLDSDEVTLDVAHA